jgi:hypothetical protein
MKAREVTEISEATDGQPTADRGDQADVVASSALSVRGMRIYSVPPIGSLRPDDLGVRVSREEWSRSIPRSGHSRVALAAETL